MITPKIKKILSAIMVAALCFTYLPVSYDIVKAQDIELEETSNTDKGTTYTYIPSLPGGTNSLRLSGSKCYVDENKYFWVDAESDEADIIRKDRVLGFYMEDESYDYYNTMLKVGSNFTNNRLYFTVSPDKNCKLSTYLYVQNGTYIGYAVYRTSDDSLVEGSERYVYDNDYKYNVVYNLEPGDYYIAKNADYDACMNIFRIDAVETDSPVNVETERKSWDEVDTPVVTGINGYGEYIYVRYKMDIGLNGADYIEATLIDSDGNEYMTRRSAMSGYGQLRYKVDHSDEYTCRIRAIRYTGEVKENVTEYKLDYQYPLLPPKPFIAYNVGDGVVKVEYSEVKEAYSYTVEYKATSDTDADWNIGAVSNKGEAYVYGLEAGKEYEFRITAHRKGESVRSDQWVGEEGNYENAKVTVSEESGAGWVRESIAGNYATPTHSYIDGDLRTGNTITIYSEDGKIARGGADGVVSTYTKMKSTSNFTISAHAKVLYWSNKSDQNGFGVFVSDQNYELTSGWNNSLQFGAMHVTNATAEVPAHDYRIGIGYTYKFGCDEEDIDVLRQDNRTNLLSLGMDRVQKVMEEREQYQDCDYMLGNVNESSIDSKYTVGDITEFDIQLQKTGNVYTMTYTSADGSYSNTQSIDVGDSFNVLDKDYIYVGLFAGRQSTHVEFSDVQFNINDEADYSKVDEAIAKADSLDRNEYEGFGQVDEIIKTIERGLKSDCQGKVLIMAKNLNDAINSLKLKKKEITNDDGTTTTISSTDTIKGGEKIEVTGDKEESYVSIKSEPGENAVKSEIKADSEQELIDSVLTDNEKAQVENGESVSISLKVENSSESKDAAKEIEKVIKKSETDSSKKIGALLDISIEKTIGKKLLGTRELNSEIELSVDVPSSLEKVIKEDGKTYKVARNHEGVVDLIDAVYNAATNKLTFKTDRFSTYALLYDSVIPKIEPYVYARTNQTASDMNDVYKLYNIIGEVHDKDNNIITGVDFLKTGYRITYKMSDEVISIATIVVKGDVDGNGAIDVLDMEAIQKSILGISKLEGEYRIAAKLTDQSDDISVLDMEAIQKDILGIQKIN